jgi:toxin ParE1/3/4
LSRKVGFTPGAQEDLFHLQSYIAARSGQKRAIAYCERIHAYCMGLSAFSEIGTRRFDLRPGLRIVGFKKRVAIAFHVTADTVIIDRILYGGRDLASALSEEG